MKHRLKARWLPVLGALALAACDDSQPTDPFQDDALLSQEDALALDILTDPGAIDAALALAEGPVRAARRHGPGAHGGDSQATRARQRFQEAVHALQAGDRVRAMDRAREARTLVAQSVQTTQGAAGLVAMVERAEGLAESVGLDPDAYDQPQALQGELAQLASGARVQLHQGDSTGAGRRAVLAEQRRHQRRKAPGNRPGGAALLVDLGATAVSLATRLLEDQGADDEQLRFLATAAEHQAEAEAALANGNERRAVHLAQLAHWTALKAVVLPGGVTAEEARAMLDLAEGLYAEAVASEPTDELKVTLLQRARTLIDLGASKLEDGQHRGVGPLWKAAVVCSWIIG